MALDAVSTSLSFEWSVIGQRRIEVMVVLRWNRNSLSNCIFAKKPQKMQNSKKRIQVINNLSLMVKGTSLTDGVLYCKRRIRQTDSGVEQVPRDCVVKIC